MKFIKTKLDGVVIIEPKILGDERGWFAETFRQDLFMHNVFDVEFVQENESFSRYGVIRGLHYQLPPFSQGKLVRAIEGRVLDVAVDLRQGSPTFGEHVSVELSAENNKQLFVPRGFAHGFSVLSEVARLQYKCDQYYMPKYEGGVRYDDPVLDIDWGVEEGDVILSDKDKNAPNLADAKLFEYSKKLY